jgi:hypothetical protein
MRYRREGDMKNPVSIAWRFLLVICILAPAIAFGDKKDAGEIIGDSMYVDNTFGFSLTKIDTWKFKKVFKDKDITRVVLIKKNPTMLTQFTDRKDYFTQPQVTVLAYEKKAKPKEYAAFLIDDKGKDDLKKKAYQRFVLFQTESKYNFEHQKTRSTKIGGEYAARIKGRKQYYWAFEGEGASDEGRSGFARGEILSGYVSGSIYVICTEKHIVLVECVGERELIRKLSDDFDAILDGFAFSDDD